MTPIEGAPCEGAECCSSCCYPQGGCGPGGGDRGCDAAGVAGHDSGEPSVAPSDNEGGIREGGGSLGAEIEQALRGNGSRGFELGSCLGVWHTASRGERIGGGFGSLHIKHCGIAGACGSGCRIIYGCRVSICRSRPVHAVVNGTKLLCAHQEQVATIMCFPILRRCSGAKRERQH